MPSDDLDPLAVAVILIDRLPDPRLVDPMDPRLTTLGEVITRATLDTQARHRALATRVSTDDLDDVAAEYLEAVALAARVQRHAAVQQLVDDYTARMPVVR